jgi:integrase
MDTYLGKLIADRMTQTTDSEFLFPSWGKTGRITEVHKAVAKVAEISGVPFALHDLRRTVATIAESLDISTYAIKRLLNHSVNQNDVTSGYIVTDVERLRKPMQQIEDSILAAAGEGKTSNATKRQSKDKPTTQTSKGKSKANAVSGQTGR